jgi:hypothetical protein
MTGIAFPRVLYMGEPGLDSGKANLTTRWALVALSTRRIRSAKGTLGVVAFRALLLRRSWQLRVLGLGDFGMAIDAACLAHTSMSFMVE